MYMVMEFQNGQLGERFWSYETLEDAESKYFLVLSYACKSDVKSHTVMLVNDRGDIHGVKTYQRQEIGD